MFLDLDGDRAQGSGEPAGVTDASGAFSVAINEVTPLLRLCQQIKTTHGENFITRMLFRAIRTDLIFSTALGKILKLPQLFAEFARVKLT